MEKIIQADIFAGKRKRRIGGLDWDRWEPVIRFGLIILGFGIILLAYQMKLFENWSLYRMEMNEQYFFRRLFLFSFVILILSFILRTFLWFKYKSADPQKVRQWPNITVIVPAYNEGGAVYQTLSSIATCDYPKNLMEIVAVDDGSKDDTYKYMRLAEKEFPNLIRILKLPQNKGKRHAIYAGYKKKGQGSAFVISVDSDTRMETNAIKEILTPMILNQKIGAVTGRIKVWNRTKNPLTRMLSAHFAMAFDFTRAIQASFHAVFCLSGAFAAYRASILGNVIEKWVSQKFLFKPCTYGEDRSLTNFFLRSGHGTYYQRTAIVYTLVPESLRKVLKMFTRWGRSNIRESFILSTFILNSRRKGNRILPFIEFFSTNALIIFHFIWFYYFLFSGYFGTNYMIRILAFSTLFGFFYMLYYLRIEKKGDFSYILLFSLFSSVFMVWIFTLAALTLTRQTWSTR